ncbi:MAG TPA: SDR family oxidoreductase [Terriglobales bacterium]|nr:SDR family oxidoreductase [Terriglobales bacterium]
MAANKPQSKRKRITHRRLVTPAASELRLLDKVAVVTGASRGIGQAIAGALAAEGCAVVITGRDGLALIKSMAQIEKRLGPRMIIPVVCDVRDEKSVGALFAEVERRFGKIDVLVNNAGITQRVVTVEETTLEMWRDVLDTNLTGTFLCTRAALPMMQAGATIINNLSAAAKQVFPKFATYSAAKRGALGFTLSLREELIPRGIRVVALMPGATATDMWDQIMPDAPRERMMSVESVAQAVLYAVLLPPGANLSELLLEPTSGAL